MCLKCLRTHRWPAEPPQQDRHNNGCHNTNRHNNNCHNNDRQNVLNVLNLLNVLKMPKDPSLACWALFLLLNQCYRKPCRACHDCHESYNHSCIHTYKWTHRWLYKPCSTVLPLYLWSSDAITSLLHYFSISMLLSKWWPPSHWDSLPTFSKLYLFPFLAFRCFQRMENIEGLKTRGWEPNEAVFAYLRIAGPMFGLRGE